MSPGHRYFPSRRRSLRDWFLLGEAGIMLMTARVTLKFLPTARIVHWMRRPMPRRIAAGEPSIHLKQIRWAVTAFSRNSPIRLVCFPQALAMHAMLRRRGISSEVLYGVARIADGTLVAHAWLRKEDRIWLGGEVSTSFTVLDVWKPADSIQYSSTRATGEPK